MARVLLVEDEYCIAADLQQCLEAAGFEVLGPLGSGEEAAASGLARGADVAVLDVNLRGRMDGVAAAAAMRRDGKPALVFLTGYDDGAIRGRAAALDPVAFFVKPVRPARIVEAIEKHLGGR